MHMFAADLELGPLPSARPRSLEEGEALTADGR